MVFILYRTLDGEEVVANPNCTKYHLLRYLVYKSGLDVHDVEMIQNNLEICDTKGQLTGVINLNEHENVSSRLEPRETYVLIKYVPHAKGSTPKYQPLLQETDEIYKTITKKLGHKKGLSSPDKNRKKAKGQSSPSKDGSPKGKASKGAKGKGDAKGAKGKKK